MGLVVRAAGVAAILSMAAPALAGGSRPQIPPSLVNLKNAHGQTPSDLDLTGSPLARSLAQNVALGAIDHRNHAAFAAAPIPGWTVTQVGNYVIVQDDGTHNCDNLSMSSGAAFDTCIGGGAAAGGGNTGAIDAFYAAFPGTNPGYVVTYLAWDAGGFGGAFYAPIAADTQGIGQTHFTGSDTFGDPSGLNGWIFMNSLQQYSGFGAQNQELLFDLIWGQEFEHRWAAFVHFSDGGTDSKGLVGRQEAHWSFFVDTPWSWMEGNKWKIDNGAFVTDEAAFALGVSHKSQMDLYLMGLIPPTAVDPFMLIKNPSGSHHPADPPQILSGGPATVHGSKKMVSVNDVIKVEGERIPTFVEQPRNFQVATLIILRHSDDPADATMRSTMQTFADGETSQFALETHDLAHVDTTLGAPLPNVNPTAAFTLPVDGKQNEESTLDASGSADTDGTVKGYVWEFGDGSGDYLSGKTVTHKWKKGGTLNVTLTVVDDLGGHDTTTHSIEVAAAPADNKGPLGCGCSLAAGATVNPFAAGALALAALLGFFVRRKTA